MRLREHEWKSWPRAEGDHVTTWNSHRCAMCGTSGGTVFDHCHNTGLIRGHLCRSCNQLEPGSQAPRWKAWRAWDNPARALNCPVVYDRGILEHTPLYPGADVSYLTLPEREAWWAHQEVAARRGEDWPTAHAVDIEARREAELEELRTVLNGVTEMLLNGGESA